MIQVLWYLNFHQELKAAPCISLVLVLQLFVGHVGKLCCVTKDYVRKGWRKLLNDEFYDFIKWSLGGSVEGECGVRRRRGNENCLNIYFLGCWREWTTREASYFRRQYYTTTGRKYTEYLNVVWIHLALCRVHWPDFVNTVMNFRAPSEGFVDNLSNC